MTESLNSDDVEALFTLIYLLKDTPVQAEEAAGLLREQTRRRATVLNDAREFAPRASAQPPRSRRGANELADHIVAANQALDRWFSLGDPPPALPLVSIQFKLIAAEAEALERAFLAVVCRHFGAAVGDRYQVLLDRATECSVYPLAEEVAGQLDVPSEPGERAAGLFEDSSLDDEGTDGTGTARAERIQAEPPPATPRPKTRSADRVTFAPLPDGPRVDQARRAREALFESPVSPAPKRLWGLFDNLVR